MINESIQMLSNIYEALMTISVKGDDVITLSNCFQALRQVIESEMAQQQAEENKEEE